MFCTIHLKEVDMYLSMIQSTIIGNNYDLMQF